MTEEKKNVDGQATEMEMELDEASIAGDDIAGESEPATDKTSELEKKLEEVENRYFRLQADFDNYRRRVKLDAEAAEKYRSLSLISDILPTLDNFERALNMEIEGDQAKSLMEGMEMVYRGLLDALKKEGLQPIEAVGKPFDPHFHQAVMQVEDDSFDPNSVVEEFQKGYLLKDRVIRHSMVKVNQ
ncbi:nucleotide exchange factor GrpE [Bacillus sp. FJAT-27445]|uniref:nucleotide exchange factor GrpE n=1 Tax=Bacillus sp. FJAT-27445 TaxID=1679166 RepID=UPI000A40CB6B|nr:nucleotide exchange factor GrpE [Bacillus sp. FJAT-27445]